MIEIDIGDDRKNRIDDIGCVEASSQANFKDSDFDLGCGKEVERYGGHGLKEAGQMRQLRVLDHLCGAGRNTVKSIDEGFIGDGPAVETDALIDAHDVRRGIKADACPEACRMEAIVAAVEPLPLVPAISTEGNGFGGLPRAWQNARMCASSNLREVPGLSSWPREEALIAEA